jgi:predicted transcriptional regulator
LTIGVSHATVDGVGKPRKALARIGELELAVLEHLWGVDEADVSMTHAAIGAARGITTNTVGSALERLHRKGLVAREKISHAYRYRSALSREEFAAKRMLDAAAGQRTLTDAGLLAAFVDLVADEDEASLDRLELLIAAKRNKQGDK